MTTLTITTLDSILATGALVDYLPVAPRPATYDIDASVAAECACARCGQEGLSYRPFTRPATRWRFQSYRAFAVCPSCGHTEEM